MTAAPRFLCDEMLAGLARWLRAAGYDAMLPEPGQHDGALVARALAEDRILLTCERRLPRDPAQHAVRIVVLPTDGVDVQATALTQALGLGWDAAPFSRCMEDNTVLRAADDAAMAQVPPAAAALGGPFRQCPVCRRVYWPGQHLFRMHRRLRGFARPAAGD